MNPNTVNLMMPVFILFIMYFLLIRPQMKQQKQTAQMQSKLKKNDEVVTTGGIHGTVVNVKDGIVTLRVDENVRIDVDKSSIGRLVKEG